MGAALNNNISAGIPCKMQTVFLGIRRRENKHIVLQSVLSARIVKVRSHVVIELIREIHGSLASGLCVRIEFYNGRSGKRRRQLIHPYSVLFVDKHG